MIPMRQSAAETKNALLIEDEPAAPPSPAAPSKGVAAGRARGNIAWMRRARSQQGLGDPGDVLLIGGQSLVDFRIRLAQSHARHDLTPSYWSMVGIADEDDMLITVPLSTGTDPSLVPATNGIAKLPIADFDDAERYPNIAVLRFPPGTAPVRSRLEQVRTQRSIADLPALVVGWLGFVWGNADSPNPLVAGLGVPSAVLVETLFGLVDVELTPGLASASSCPEAIWQSVKWWHEFYNQAVAGRKATAKPSRRTSPWGRCLVRQRLATYIEPKPPDL